MIQPDCRDEPGCSFSCGISSLAIVPDRIFLPLRPPPTLYVLFDCNKFISASFIEAFAVSGEIVFVRFLKKYPQFNG